MKIIKPSIEFLWMTPDGLQAIERAGRTCYKSEDRITADSAPRFVKMLLDRKHEAMIEHASMAYRVITDRGVTHEIVRHRLFSYAQESTRYCNYAGKDMEFLCPLPDYQIVDLTNPINPTVTPATETYRVWECMMINAEIAYTKMIELGEKPEIARSILPNSLKTEIVITGNFREWRHFFKMRTAKEAHPQMRQVATMILFDAQLRVPVVFDEYSPTKTRSTYANPLSTP